MTVAVFRHQVSVCLSCLDKVRKPARETYLKIARELTDWRRARGMAGLWDDPPLMVTATVDDGWGHGLEIIERLAASVGLRVRPLGLLRPAAYIVSECRRLKPDLLGLTVLQFDSDAAVAAVTRGLPSETRLVAGGAAYQYDPDFAKRTGTHVVASNGRAFLSFLVNFSPVTSE